MKKRIALFLCTALMAASLAGCGSDQKETEAPRTEAVTEAVTEEVTEAAGTEEVTEEATEAAETETEEVTEATETETEEATEAAESETEEATEAAETETEEATEAAETETEEVTEAAETETEEATEAAETETEEVTEVAESETTEAMEAAEAAESETEEVTEAAETETEEVTEAAETETEEVTEAVETETEEATEAVETETEEATEAAESETEEATEAAETETEEVTEAAETETETEEATEVAESETEEATEAAETETEEVTEAADSETEEISEAADEDNPFYGQTVKVGCSATFVPYESIEMAADGSKTYIGMNIDLITDIVEENGGTVEFVDMPFKSLIAAIQAGQIDFCSGGMAPTEERQESLDFSEIFFYPRNAIVYRAEDDYPDLDSLAGKTVAYVFGTNYQQVAESIEDVEAVGIQGSPACIEEVKSKRADACIVDGAGAVEFLKENDGLAMSLLDRTEDCFAIGFPKDSPYYEAFNESLKEKMENGDLDEIIAEYLSEQFILE